MLKLYENLDCDKLINYETLFLGNSANRSSGFGGSIDEIRYSPVAQSYYPADLDWPAPREMLGRRLDVPYIRDTADLLFYLC